MVCRLRQQHTDQSGPLLTKAEGPVLAAQHGFCFFAFLNKTGECTLNPICAYQSLQNWHVHARAIIGFNARTWKCDISKSAHSL